MHLQWRRVQLKWWDAWNEWIHEVFFVCVSIEIKLDLPLGRYPPETTTGSNSVWDLRVDCKPCISGNWVCNILLTACICRTVSIPFLTILLSMQQRSKLGFHTLFLEICREDTVIQHNVLHNAEATQFIQILAYRKRIELQLSICVTTISFKSFWGSSSHSCLTNDMVSSGMDLIGPMPETPRGNKYVQLP